ncbi:nickel insertion protein [Adlercreutzia sp. ZJ154]|uniref:nickel insertion protein n=1 Tax=Adlercreutzia sp. ZJ154 TaxID=2709790 RepID=UPI0013E9D45B|nr:nickel insertion protein [Adlercreutzia sp. ZJ154]
MTTLYLDCSQGVQKDTFAMCVGALLPREKCNAIAQASGVADVVSAGEVVNAGGGGNVGAGGNAGGGGNANDANASAHHHHSMTEVRAKIEAKPLSQAAIAAALGVYDILAEAEARVHGASTEDVHLHEVGSDEAIAWVCAAAASMVELAADNVVAGPVCTGFGFVDCSHGRLSIPAPATADILEGIPTFVGDVEGELTTPTGAALVRYFAEQFVSGEPAGCELVAQVGSW